MISDRFRDLKIYWSSCFAINEWMRDNAVFRSQLRWPYGNYQVLVCFKLLRWFCDCCEIEGNFLHTRMSLRDFSFLWDQTIGGWLKICLSLAGLLIFHTVTELQNSGKSTKSLKIHQKAHNTAQFVRNNIKYVSVQHIWNLFQLLGLFSCCKLANLSGNFVTETCKQHPETTLHRLYYENWALGSFLEHIVVNEQNNDDLS